jgi:hypothetical protein
MGGGVFGHSQVVENCSDIASELAHFLGNAGYAFGFDQGNGKTAEACYVFGTIAGAYPPSILIVIPVDDIVAAVLDSPVAAIDLKESLCVGLVGRSAGNSMDEFIGIFAGFLINTVTFDDKGLSDVRKVQVVIELGGGPDFSRFNASMVRRIKKDVVWFLAILEEERDVLKDRGLVSLDGEVIVTVAVFDDVFSELTLS